MAGMYGRTGQTIYNFLETYYENTERSIKQHSGGTAVVISSDIRFHNSTLRYTIYLHVLYFLLLNCGFSVKVKQKQWRKLSEIKRARKTTIFFTLLIK